MNLKMSILKDDKEFFLECIKSSDYKEYISHDETLKKYDFNNILIVEDNNNNNYGFIQLTDIDYINKNVNLNIYMKNKKSMINILSVFQAVSYLIKDLGFHKVIIKVKSNNLNMINILQKLDVTQEGIIENINYNEKLIDVYIFSILDWEYESMKNKFKRRN
jgi:RimJ/RimL family protein N-acetyltransferase